ncbi:MAG TPA: efflux RND transporter periplasmic adaptor subunit [Candidatus Acidoferrales bacterium]|jgi:cobalt-zinc-cadmium efflux system membrane fusion protein|nr:efflux RND transporter periplasmic adaptor subunit [Candidatus Acidoferrales bacterium]
MRRIDYVGVVISAAAMLLLQGCGGTKADPAAEAPPQAKVESEQDLSVIQVDHPDQFPLAAAAQYSSATQLVVTGTVNPDISRAVPVISLASGRIVDIGARLGDTVKKGQVLLRVRSDDISLAYSDYRKAVADEILARTQFERSQLLYDHGAISQNDLQVAKDTEDKAKVDVETTSEHLLLIGGDLDHPTGIVDILAPISGVITDQQVTNAAGVQALGTSPFTISDLSRVWVLCDVYENDLPNVHLGEMAEIRLNAYPDKVFKGTISNISPTLDPTIRTAKVRLEVANPGLMRVGMFVSATFHGQKKETHASVPSSAVLHLHDRDWVYVPAGDKKFRRVEIVAGDMLPGNMQEVISGIQAGQQVVANALVLQNASEQ